jgi:hypothetical protein
MFAHLFKKHTQVKMHQSDFIFTSLKIVSSIIDYALAKNLAALTQ